VVTDHEATRASEGHGASSLRAWAARLSHPSVELLVHGDHVILQEHGELIASGSVVAVSPLDGHWGPREAL
jgi:hypothetical protein